jgi:hypothetical protein
VPLFTCRVRKVGKPVVGGIGNGKSLASYRELSRKIKDQRGRQLIRDSFDRNDLEEAAEGVDRAMELQACLERAEVVFTSDCVRRVGPKLGADPVNQRL